MWAKAYRCTCALACIYICTHKQACLPHQGGMRHCVHMCTSMQERMCTCKLAHTQVPYHTRRACAAVCRRHEEGCWTEYSVCNAGNSAHRLTGDSRKTCVVLVRGTARCARALARGQMHHCQHSSSPSASTAWNSHAPSAQHQTCTASTYDAWSDPAMGHCM